MGLKTRVGRELLFLISILIFLMAMLFNQSHKYLRDGFLIHFLFIYVYGGCSI